MNMFHSISASSRGKGAYLLSALFVVLTGTIFFMLPSGANAQSAAPTVPAPASGVPKALPADHLIDVLNKVKPGFNASDASTFSGTVKIGGATEAAVAALEIAGSITIQKGNSLKLLTTIGNERGILFAQEASPHLIIRTSGSENIALQDGTDTNLFIQGSNGNVGIGKTDPQRNLHVYGTSGNVMKIENYGTGNAVLEIQSDNNRQTAINFLNSSGSAMGQLAYDQATGTMTLNTAGAERMRIDAQGKVGIGTPTPDSKLDISGFLKAGGVAADKNPLVVMAGSKAFPSSDQTQNNWSANGAYWASPMIYRSIRFPDEKGGAFPDNNYGELMLQGTSHGDGYNRGISFVTTPNDTTNPAIRMRINPAGNVGIGTSSPNLATLQVQSDNAYLFYVGKSDGSDRFAVKKDGTSYFYGGNVGIGKSDPGAKLEVSSDAINTPIWVRNTSTGGDVWSVESIGNVEGRKGNFEINRPGIMSGLAITGSGNVGIGTSSPAPNIADSRLLQIDHPKNSIFGLRTTDTTAGVVRLAIGALTDGTYPRGAIQVDSDHDLSFYTKSTLRAAILKSGEFQIGTADTQTPSAQLLVEQEDTSINDVLRVQRKKTDKSLTTDLFVNRDGVVGIGGGIPDPNTTTAKLYVHGPINASKYCLKGDSNNCIEDWKAFSNWGNTGSDIYSRNLDSKVGIGTQTPSAKLDVQGTVAISPSSLIVSGRGYNCPNCTASASLELYNATSGRTSLSNPNFGIVLQPGSESSVEIGPHTWFYNNHALIRNGALVVGTNNAWWPSATLDVQSTPIKYPGLYILRQSPPYFKLSDTSGWSIDGIVSVGDIVVNNAGVKATITEYIQNFKFIKVDNPSFDANNEELRLIKSAFKVTDNSGNNQLVLSPSGNLVTTINNATTSYDDPYKIEGITIRNNSGTTNTMAGLQFSSGVGSAAGIYTQATGGDNTDINFWTESGSRSVKMTLKDNGNVGIRTTETKANLHVAFTPPTLVPAAGAGSLIPGLFLSSANGSYGLMAGVLSDGKGWIQSQQETDSATKYPLLLNPNGGNVGIGNTNPQAGLSVTPETKSWSEGIEINPAPNNYNGIYFRETAGTEAGTWFAGRFARQEPLSGAYAIARNGISGMIGTSRADTPFAIKKDGTSLFGGSVGIGLDNYTPCPLCKLDVKNGDINVAFNSDQRIAELPEKTKIAYETDRVGLDVAELFESEEDVEVGEIVVVADTNRKLKKSSAQYQGTIVGVVSGAPALLFEGSQLKLGSNPNRFEKGTKPPIALAGRIPVKVSLENGSIKPGDYLTSSSKPGIAMKATAPGMTIGVALENYAGSGDDKILVFLNPGEKNTSSVIKELQQSEQETKGLLKSLERRLRMLEYKPLW